MVCCRCLQTCWIADRSVCMYVSYQIYKTNFGSYTRKCRSPWPGLDSGFQRRDQNVSASHDTVSYNFLRFGDNFVRILSAIIFTIIESTKLCCHCLNLSRPSIAVVAVTLTIKFEWRRTVLEVVHV